MIGLELVKKENPMEMGTPLIVEEVENVEVETPIETETPPIEVGTENLPKIVREGNLLKGKLRELSEYREHLEREIGSILQLQNNPEIRPPFFSGEEYYPIQFFKEELKKFNEISLKVSRLKRREHDPLELRQLRFQKRLRFKNCIPGLRFPALIVQPEISGVYTKGFDFELHRAYVQFRKEFQYKLELFSKVPEEDPLRIDKIHILREFLDRKLGCQNLTEFLEDCFEDGIPPLKVVERNNRG